MRYRCLSVTDRSGYADKQHSLVIAWRTNKLRRAGMREIRFDETAYSETAPEREDGQEPKRRIGLTRVTRNVGLILALELQDGSGGVIVATTHAHWHVACASAGSAGPR